MRRILHFIGLAVILICDGAVAASRAADEWDQKSSNTQEQA
jgi:hypothetical protein